MASIVEPKIEHLLDATDGNEFLLCAVAAKRSHDITSMIHGQRSRALELAMPENVTDVSGKNPLSIALDEVAEGKVSYNSDDVEDDLVDRGIKER